MSPPPRTPSPLLAGEQRTREIADALPQIFGSADADGRIDFLNAQWTAVTGLPAGAGDHGPAVLGVVHPQDRVPLQAALERARDAAGSPATGTPHSVSLRLRGTDGDWRWFRVDVAALQDTAAGLRRWYGMAVETDEAVRSQQALADADRRRDVFLATLAHELRNPLAPIRTATHVMLASATQPARLAWAADIINRQVGAMGLLLDDLLEVSRITRGALALNKDRMVLRGIVDAAVELARPALDERGHTLTVQGDALDDLLDADPLRLTQVLGNLLDNAARYTDRGGRIVLSAHARPGAIELAVADDGIGIAPDDLERVFEMFWQVRGSDGPGGASPEPRPGEPDPARGRNSRGACTEGGLGIGLALVKGLVALHGGHVEAASAGAGRGSVFRVVLPVAGVAAPPPVPRAAVGRAQPAGALDVVVVDDNRDSADTMAALLEAAGHRVEVAYDGIEGLEKIARRRPQAALIDIGMPRLDGCEVARRIRSESWGAEPFLIAVTGWGQPEDQQRTQASGFDRHLVKPVDPDRIVQLLADRGRLRAGALPSTAGDRAGNDEDRALSR